MQLHDKQIVKQKCTKGNKLIPNGEIYLVNYDLHRKVKGRRIHAAIGNKRGGLLLYGVIVAGDKDKWDWILTELATANEIKNKYGITKNLPASSRGNARFIEQLRSARDIPIRQDVLVGVDWADVKQIYSLKKQPCLFKSKKYVESNTFHREILKAWDTAETIPIVINHKKEHHIEAVKILTLGNEAGTLSLGVSCKPEQVGDHEDNQGFKKNKYSISRIYLDGRDILNKYFLLGGSSFALANYYTTKLNFSIREIVFSNSSPSNDEATKMHKKCAELTKQLSDVSERYERLLRITNEVFLKGKSEKISYIGRKYKPVQKSAEMYVLTEDFGHNKIDDNDDDKILDINSNLYNGLAGLLDDKQEDGYMTSEFCSVYHKENPISFVSDTVCINKLLLSKLLYEIQKPVFDSAKELKQWLYGTMALQMVSGEAKQYHKYSNGKMLAAILNTDLHINGKLVYAVMIDTGNRANKYDYELLSLMNKTQIKSQYGIDSEDLPTSIRAKEFYLSQFSKSEGLAEKDLRDIHWNDVNIVQNKSNKPQTASMTMPFYLMDQYSLAAFKISQYEKMKANSKLNSYGLIPMIGFYRNKWCAEWGLEVPLAHRDSSLVLSFVHSDATNRLVPHSIYLNSDEVKAKGKLTCLRNNACNALDFSIKKFKFKSLEECIDGNFGRNALDMIQRYKEQMEKNDIQYSRTENENAQLRLLNADLQRKNALLKNDLLQRDIKDLLASNPKSSHIMRNLVESINSGSNLPKQVNNTQFSSSASCLKGI